MSQGIPVADTDIPTYRHPFQEGLRHFIFLFQLVRHTVYTSSHLPSLPNLLPAPTPARLQVFLDLTYLLVLWFIYKSCSGWWCPAYKDFQIFVEQMICLGDSPLLGTSSILGDPLPRVWLPVAVLVYVLCLCTACVTSLTACFFHSKTELIISIT